MNKQDELNKKIFNRLFLKMPTVRKIKTQINKVANIKLDKSIRYFYYSKNDKMWFAHSENKSKYFYFFGIHEDHITKLNHLEDFIMIDFDKNNNINNHSLGIINDADETVYLNKEILEEQYPYNNFKNYKEHILTYFERSVKIEIPSLELGKLYGTFFNNLQRLIKELLLSETQKPKSSNSSNEKIPNINLFLNAIKAGKSYEQSLNIAKVDSSTVKYWYNFGKKGNEKYVEFYETYKEIMPRDEETYEKMNIVIDSLKSGESEELSLSNANVNQEDLKKWIKKGKNGEMEYLDFYEDYNEIDKNNKNLKRTEHKSKNQELIQEYIKLIDEGKTNKEAFETLNIPRHKTKNWKQQGQLGNPNYVEFYKTYLKAIEMEKAQKLAETKKEDEKLIKEYVKLINEGKTNKEAFETLNIPRYKTKNWKQQGQLENKDYTEFYETYLKAVKREEIEKANQFIKLIDEGKSNEEAMQIIKMPEFKIKQWFNNGKTGDKDFIEFYKACMKQYDTDIEMEDNIPTSNLKPSVSEAPDENTKTCEICGRSMNESDQNTICKRCRRKQRCANIAQQLLLSIEPEVPFKKEDLKKLDLTSIQIQDYIWTLQEFSLIKKEKNNKFALVKKEIIDEFIEESCVEIIDEPASEIKLSKTCKICGETLEISKFPISEKSPDGYEDNCKNCKKLITSANYLKELLDYVQFEQEFREDDLAKFIQDPFLRQAKVWSLLENDLLIRNEENNKLKLADEEKCNKFLDKYLNEQFFVKPKNSETSHDEPPVLTKKEQMEIILNARREGKTRKESAKLAEISAYKITHWYKEGRDGFGKENIDFYKKLKNIETHLLKKLKKQMNTVIKELKSGSTVSEAIDKAGITQEELDKWIKRGKNDIKPYKSFLEKYMKYVKSSTDYNDNYNTKAREKFLKYISEGKTRKEAAQKALIDLKLIDSWIIQGTKGKKPYNKFYKDYLEVRKNVGGKSSSHEEKIKNEFIELLKKGYTHGEASRLIENGKYSVDIKKWYVAGKSGVSKHIKFYMKCQSAKNSYKTKKEKILTLISDGFTIKQACEKLKLEPNNIKQEILKGKNNEEPYKTFYNKIIKSKSSLINTKQLFKSPYHPHKDQMIDFLDMLLIGIKEDEALKTANIDEVTFKYWLNRGKQQFGTLYTEFYNNYNQIKSGDLINKFKKEIVVELDHELDEIENVNADILAPLPKQIRNELDNLSKETHSGFGWVNKIGNLWTYSRRIDRRNIKITDIDLRNLHKKVIKNNLIWGVRDLKLAKQSLALSDKNGIEDNNQINSPSDILQPLPENLNTKFFKGTSTGFAWVSKVGNYFYYTRNNKNIRFKSSGVSELYNKVKSENLEWGVIDLEKARQTLNSVEDEKPSKINAEKKNNPDLLAPLPDEIEKELNKYSKESSTGFAWVSKVGKKFRYERVVNGSLITISEPTIEELYKKVINRDLEWGVRDLTKAKNTLNEKPIEETKLKIDMNKFSKNIYGAFPEEYDDLFKSSPTNKSGIAWVSKVGNRWTYKRQIDGKTLEIYDNNIFKLHQKVLKQKQPWGIRDYKKAKISLTERPIDDADYILKEISYNEIIKYENTESGFILVDKNGPKWEYLRQYNGKRINDDNLFGLFEKILEKNLKWGVLDISKAKKSLGLKETKKNTNNNILLQYKQSIFTPLPEEFKNLFKNNKDANGIAWVKKISNTWRYNRLKDGEQIFLEDENIFKLYYKVINENLIWGTTDVNKAMKTINKETNYILNPLSKENKKDLDQTYYDTGFAWITRDENTWKYEKIIYGNTVSLKHKDIFKLHELIIKYNHIWGVTDLISAVKTLSEPIAEIKIYNNINNNILRFLPKPIEEKLSEKSKRTSTGFAWVIRKDGYYVYKKRTKDGIIALKNVDIYELYKQVEKQELLWGVRDLTKARKTLNKNNLRKINTPTEVLNQDFLAKLPDEHEKTFRNNVNKSGFAWVSKIGDNWKYSRKVNGKQVTLKDKDLHKLHEKVIDQQLTWGVRDLTKAKKSISDNENNEENEKTNENILKPLPLEIELKLRRNSKGNASGFAWVSKVGDKWQYTKVVNGIPIHLKDTDIYNLHEIVLKNNHIWGVRDLTKAKQTLKDCNKKLPKPPKIDKLPDKTIQKSLKDNSKKQIDKTDILAPLPKKYYKEYKKSKTSATGIAWVRKKGDEWSYTRKVNAKNVHIYDSDIYQLHKKVLEKNLPWGVIDSQKAKKIIFNAQPTTSTKIQSNEYKKDANMFISMNGNIISINGKIKNNELLKVLTRIYEFGDNILKINTQKNDDETTLSIDLELNENQRSEFLNKIKEFGWEIT